MSEENVKIVRSIYDALNRRDWEGAFCSVHPDFELTTKRGPRAGTHRGRERVQSFFEDYLAAFDSLVLQPEEFFEGEDRVVVILTARAMIRGSGGALQPRNGHLWTIRDGTVISMESFPVAEDALEAAGLSV